MTGMEYFQNPESLGDNDRLQFCLKREQFWCKTAKNCYKMEQIHPNGGIVICQNLQNSIHPCTMTMSAYFSTDWYNVYIFFVEFSCSEKSYMAYFSPETCISYWCCVRFKTRHRDRTIEEPKSLWHASLRNARFLFDFCAFFTKIGDFYKDRNVLLIFPRLAQALHLLWAWEPFPGRRCQEDCLALVEQGRKVYGSFGTHRDDIQPKLSFDLILLFILQYIFLHRVVSFPLKKVIFASEMFLLISK